MAVYDGPGGQDEDRGHGRNRSRTVVARVCGDLGCALGGSVANECRQAGSGMARSRARARPNFSCHGQLCGRCRVRRRAERVIRPAREKNRRRRVLVVNTPSPRPMRTVQRARLCAITCIADDDFFRSMAQARVGNSVERTFRSFLSPDLLIVEDLGLHRLTGQQSADLYELTINRHRVSSFVITSNRAVEEWLSLFDDPILGNSALDRLANANCQFVIEGTSYRERPTSHRSLLSQREVIDPPTAT